MQVSQILSWRVPRLISITPDATIVDAADLLAREGIGAVLVVDGNGDLAGIISERDIVRAMPKLGQAVFEATVADLMTAEVITCRPESDVEELMRDMTENRIRHLPVVDDGGKLSGVVSIGDVVRYRVEELEAETI